MNLKINMFLYTLNVHNSTLYVGAFGTVYRSTNNGTDWDSLSSSVFSGSSVHGLTFNGANIIAGADPNGLFISSDNGVNWTASNNGLTNKQIQYASVNGSDLFVYTYDGLFLSANNGISWTESDSGMTYSYVDCLAFNGANLFAGTYGTGIFYSNDKGASWTAVNNGLGNMNVSALVFAGGNLFAGTVGGGVYRSTDNGTSWTVMNNGLTNTSVYTFARSGANLFAGTANGVFLTTNMGTSWTSVSTGLTDKLMISVVCEGNYLFAGTRDFNPLAARVWRRPLSEMITSVESPVDIPAQINLEQNYPNPFSVNANGTTINFSIPSSMYVSLRVYDHLGKEVSSLVSEELSAGSYSRYWKGLDIPGVYFYKLQTGSHHITKKIVLLE